MPVGTEDKHDRSFERNSCRSFRGGSDDGAGFRGFPPMYLEFVRYMFCTTRCAASAKSVPEIEKRVSKGPRAVNQSPRNSFPATAPESNGNRRTQAPTTCGLNPIATASPAPSSE